MLVARRVAAVKDREALMVTDSTRATAASPPLAPLAALPQDRWVSLPRKWVAQVERESNLGGDGDGFASHLTHAATGSTTGPVTLNQVTMGGQGGSTTNGVVGRNAFVGLAASFAGEISTLPGFQDSWSSVQRLPRQWLPRSGRIILQGFHLCPGRVHLPTQELKVITPPGLH